MKKALITTANEASWFDDQPVLFLGEWCKIYSRKEVWEKMHYEVMSYHWDDKKKLAKDYEYVLSLYERTLCVLSRKMNLIHKQNRGERYWSILIGPWLAYFIMALYDRWESIRLALKKYDIGETIILVGNGEDYVANDMEEFCKIYSIGDNWNHYIYGTILNYIGHDKIIIKDDCVVFDKKNGKESVDRNIKSKVISYYNYLHKFLVKSNDPFFFKTYVSPFHECILSLKMGVLPQLWRSINSVKVGYDADKRNWDIVYKYENDFERYLLSMIPKQIPKIFLEGYNHLCMQYEGLMWPKKPKFIFTSNAIWHETVAMGYMANKIEQGSKLIYGQHGGVYGQAGFTFSEYFEKKVADVYLTWGWKESSDTVSKKIFPVGIFKKIKKRRYKNIDRKYLLFVLSSHPRYSSLMSTFTGNNEGLKTIFESVKFIKILKNTDIYKNILVRLYVNQYGWDDKNRIIDEFCDINIEEGKTSIWKLIAKTKLVVYTYYGTGYLEMIAAGIPTIIICDLNVYPVRDSNVKDMENLRRVGILHYKPESAAEHIKKIWPNVNKWWMSEEVQYVIEKFQKKYCDHTNNKITEILKKV